MVLRARYIFRDFVTDGVPSSGPHSPDKADIREWGDLVDSIVQSASGGSGGAASIFATRDDLYAALTPIANSMAWVVADAIAERNGIYRKLGASGAGSWTRVADLPYSFVVATDTGTGTPNAIQAVSNIPVSASTLIIFKVFATNDASPVTVSFNAGAALTIKTNSGSNIAIGGLTAGMHVMGIISGANFQLVTDQVSGAIIAAAEAAADRAEAAAASIDLPDIGPSDAGKTLTVKIDLSGYELTDGSATQFGQTVMYFSANSLELAEDRLSGPVSAGPDGNGIFDGFNILTYVDVIGATNLDTSVAGKLRPSSVINYGSSTTIEAPAQVGTGNAGTLSIDLGSVIPANARVTGIRARIGTNGQSFKAKIFRKNSAGNVTLVKEQTFSASGTGIATYTFTTPYLVPNDGFSYYVGLYSTGAYGRLTGRSNAFITGGDITGVGTTASVTEGGTYTACLGLVYDPGTEAGADLSVKSVNLSMSEAPTWAALIAFVNLNGAVLNTDLTFSVTRDGSAYQSIPVGDAFPRPGGSVVAASGVVDISSLTSGTTGAWRIQSANSKVPEILAVGVMFGVN